MYSMAAYTVLCCVVQWSMVYTIYRCLALIGIILSIIILTNIVIAMVTFTTLILYIPAQVLKIN